MDINNYYLNQRLNQTNIQNKRKRQDKTKKKKQKNNLTHER